MAASSTHSSISELVSSFLESLNQTLQEQFKPLVPLFIEQTVRLTLSEYGHRCACVLRFTEALIGENNLEQMTAWRDLLTYLNIQNLKFKRIDFKSAKRKFPFSLALVNTHLEHQPITNILAIDHENGPELTDDLIRSYVSFSKKTNGFAGGREITGIWFHSTATTSLVLYNRENMLMGLISGLTFNINGHQYSFITNCQVDPEMTHRGIGKELVDRLITRFPESEGIIYPEYPNGFATRYLSTLTDITHQTQGELHLVTRVADLPFPSMEQVTDQFSEIGQASLVARGRPAYKFYTLFASFMVRQWFYTTRLGHFLS